MSLPIDVDFHSGDDAIRNSRQFCLDEETYEIVVVEDRWHLTGASFFRVRTPEGKRYILRYDESEDQWTLQSGFYGLELFARRSIEIITEGPEGIRAAEQRIVGCVSDSSQSLNATLGGLFWSHPLHANLPWNVDLPRKSEISEAGGD